MIRKIISFSIISCSVVVLGACATQPVPSVNGLYDFHYRVKWEGGAAAKPVQVFDDGSETYFQLRPGAPTPALFTADHGVMRPVTARRDGYYVVAPGVADVWRVVGSSGHGVVRGSPGPHSQAPHYASAPAGGDPASLGNSSNAVDPATATGAQSEQVDNGALPATLNGNIQSLVKQVHRLQKEIAEEKSRAYIHPAVTQRVRSFSLVVPFAEGDASLNQARASELARIASLAKAATRVDLKEISTPGGARKANLALAHKRVEVVRKNLISMGVVKSSIHVLRPKLNGAYPHISVRFSVPNLQAISGND